MHEQKFASYIPTLNHKYLQRMADAASAMDFFTKKSVMQEQGSQMLFDECESP